jgi:hypothetical protein
LTHGGKFGAVAFAFFCGSCTPPYFDIKPIGYGTSIQLKFYESGILWSSPAQPCVAQLSLVEEAWRGGDRSHRRASPRVVWQIRRSPGLRCVKLKDVEIGKVPSGFSEEFNRLPLRIGHMYAAKAQAQPFDAHALPWAVCAGRPATITWRDEDHPPPRCRG